VVIVLLAIIKASGAAQPDKRPPLRSAPWGSDPNDLH